MKLRILIIHIGFALTGVVTTMLGPILPLLSSGWNLNDAESGRLFIVQFVLSSSGALIASRFKNWLGAPRTVLIGMLMIAAGVAMVSLGQFGVGVAGIAVYGIGLGFAIPSTNLMISEIVPHNRASALNLLNFSWTVGALAAPMLIDFLIQPVGLRGLLLILAAACALTALAEIGGARGAIIEAQTIPGKLASSRAMFAVLTTVLFFLYVGIENGIAGWVPTFTRRTESVSSSTAAIVQSSFWAALLLGRLLAPLVLRRVRPAKLVFIGLMLAALGSGVIICSTDISLLVIGVLASGFGLSAVFPTAIAIFTEWYGTGGAGSIVLGVCGLGGALVPWLVGIVSAHSGRLRLGMSVNLVVAITMMVIFFLMIRVALMADRRIAPEAS